MNGQQNKSALKILLDDEKTTSEKIISHLNTIYKNDKYKTEEGDLLFQIKCPCQHSKFFVYKTSV